LKKQHQGQGSDAEQAEDRGVTKLGNMMAVGRHDGKHYDEDRTITELMVDQPHLHVVWGVHT